MKEEFVGWMKKDAHTGALHYFVFALTAPVVALGALRAMSDDLYAMAELLSIVLGVYILALVGKDSVKEKMLAYGPLLLIVDWGFWVVLSVISLYHLELRYISMVVLMPLFVQTKKIVFRIIINRNLKGDELTNLNMWSEKLQMTAGALGFFTAFLMSKMDYQISLLTALIILQISYTPCVYVDYMLWKTGKDAPAE